MRNGNFLAVDVTVETTDSVVLIHAHKLADSEITSSATLSLDPDDARTLAVIVDLIRETPQLLDALNLTAAAEVAELESSLAAGDAA